MKKWLIGGVGLLASIVVAGLVFFELILPRHQPAADITVELTPERIERGRYLAVNVLQCVDCHSERDWTLYGGPPKEPLGRRALVHRSHDTDGRCQCRAGNISRNYLYSQHNAAQGDGDRGLDRRRIDSRDSRRR